MFSKFARGTRISFQEHQQKYLNQCQKVFEKQCAELGNMIELPSDEYVRKRRHSCLTMVARRGFRSFLQRIVGRE